MIIVPIIFALNDTLVSADAKIYNCVSYIKNSAYNYTLSCIRVIKPLVMQLTCNTDLFSEQ